MTPDPVGRRGAGPIDTLRRLDAGTVLVAILLAGLVLRIFVAGILLPLSGLANDIGSFSAWGQRMASGGPGAFYEDGWFADYPPGYLYVLWVLGQIGGALTPLVGQNATGGLVKIPAMLADIAIGWLLFTLAVRWGHELIDRTRFRIRPETLGLAAATLYVFSPGVIFDSAVWGQVDAVGTLVLLGTIYALGRGWTEVAAAGAILALLVKFQFGFLVPIVAIVGLKRHLFGRSADPAHDGRRDILRVVTSLAAGVATLAALILPFGMGLYAPRADGPSCFGFPPADPSTSIIGKFCEASETYQGLSVGAINIWRNPWSGLGDSLFRGDDTVVGLTLGGLALTWQQVGTLLFGVVALLALVQVARRDDLRGILLAALVVAIAFFVLPTRVHERYLFPAIALAAPLLFAGRSWPWINAAIGTVFFLNVYWVYTADWSFVTDRVINPGVDGAPMPRDPVLAVLLGDVGIWVLGLAILVVLLVVLAHSIRALLRGPAPIDEPEPERPEAARPVPPVPPVPAASAGHEPGGAARPRRDGVLGWLSPNPSDAYLREPTRRLDRRDALVLLALVAFALVFRLWRLDVPRVHHFDEIYHGRSAAEFLSSWQEGWDRDVYEWTHPMLAKYLIAAGIVIADPNRTVGSEELEAPVSILAVAPQRSSTGQERSILFRVDGASGVLASDAETGEELVRWSAGGPIASLAIDLDQERLLVGRADRGTVETYELAGMLASPEGRAPPSGPPIETDLEAVSQVVVPDDLADPLLLRGPTRIATVDRETDAVVATAEGRYGGIGLVQGQDEEPDAVVATDPERGVVAFLEAATLEPRLDGDEEPLVVSVDVTLLGPMVVRGSGDGQQVLALTGPQPATEFVDAVPGGIAAIDADAQSRIGLVPLPGLGSLIAEQELADLVYVAGTAADGSAEVWTLEPHPERRRDDTIGLAAFDTTPIPATPTALAFDVATTGQGDDHARLLVATAAEDGAASLVRIDAASTQFAWRLAGVVFGALLVGLIYLLAATMFSRRRVAVLAAAFVAVDGMSFVMSRIAMNDIFVATFIVAAYLVFWQIWSGRWARSAWWALPLVGVLIGLAAATKWVGFYALAGLLILVLARSAIGRLVLVGGVTIAAVVGGIGAPWPFLVVMLGLLTLALVVTWARPIRIDLGEALTSLPATIAVLSGVLLAFVFAYDSVPDAREARNAVEYVFSLLARGAEAEWPAYLMLGVAGALILARAVVSLRDPSSDRRWMEPGQLGGFGWSWVGACLIVVPLTVYGLSYIPYLQLGHDWATAGGPGYGWSLDELHSQMFGYHFNLTAGHASSSPWWSWPLALKPTWFFGESYDADTIAVIYNGGNPILFWAGVPALVACAVLAWKRRSAALVLIVAAFAFQFVPWLRIERATFAYHYLTAVVFAMIAVAYLVDELLRRPAWRDLAVGYLALVAIAALLVYPLGSALPMPDWYVNAARALPPWNYGFQFPDPPSGDRAELVSANLLKAVLGGLVALGAMAFALRGRAWAERRSRARTTDDAGTPGELSSA